MTPIMLEYIAKERLRDMQREAERRHLARAANPNRGRFVKQLRRWAGNRLVSLGTRLKGTCRQNACEDMAMDRIQ